MILQREQSNDFTRELATLWTWERLKTPKGFCTFDEWADHVNSVMDASDYSEFILRDPSRNPRAVAYFACQVGQCIHHHGDVLDVGFMVINPSFKGTRSVWRAILALARLRGCSWIARKQHQPDGSIKTIYSEVKI